MGQDSVERLLGRLMTDDDFRENAKRFFGKTCMENGFQLTKKEEAIFMKMDFDQFAQWAAILDEEIKRCR